MLLREFEDTQETFFENGSLDPDIEDSIVWSGEVLEVDEATGLTIPFPPVPFCTEMVTAKPIVAAIHGTAPTPADERISG